MTGPEPRVRLSPAASALPPYPLGHVPALKAELRARGVDVIDLGAGDPDLPPPRVAVEALARTAADPTYSRYPFQRGLPAFREAVARWMERRFGVRLDPNREILPLIGSKEGLAHLAMALLGPGDAALVPDPGYQAYLGGTILAGAEAVRVPLRARDGFLVPLGDIPGEVRRRLRLIFLNYPNNPTAAVAPREYLEEAVAFARETGAVLAYDHAYSEIAFDGYRPPGILEVPGAREVAVEFHSLSKTYNMTGWRLGWAAGGAPLIEALGRVKSFVDTGAFLAVQAAGVAALEAYDEWVPGNVAAFRERRDEAVEAFRGAGFRVDPPRATLYLWIPVPGGGDAGGFARRALEERGVVVLPGSALGAGGEGYFRVALTVPAPRIREAAERLAGLVP